MLLECPRRSLFFLPPTTLTNVHRRSCTSTATVGEAMTVAGDPIWWAYSFLMTQISDLSGNPPVRPSTWPGGYRHPPGLAPVLTETDREHPCRDATSRQKGVRTVVLSFGVRTISVVQGDELSFTLSTGEKLQGFVHEEWIRCEPVLKATALDLKPKPT